MKKGAIELSMTTIIIIVIGIVILSVGLVWVRNTFVQVTQFTEEAFRTADAEVGSITEQSDKHLALVPDSTDLKQGETAETRVIINNLGSEPASVVASVTITSLGSGPIDNIACLFTDTGTTDSLTYELVSGESVNGLRLFVSDKGAGVGEAYSCVVTVTGLSEGTQTTSLIINVEK